MDVIDSGPEKGPKVAAEVAESEFVRFCESMELDVDLTAMDDEDKAGFRQAKRRMIDAMMRGKLVVDDDGQPVYTPSKGNVAPITFREPTGASLMAMDSKRAGHDVTKMYSTMADLTQESVQRFSKMLNRDLRVCLAITMLFLG